MDNKTVIFNPYKQEFVPINSSEGNYIQYLEKICLKCNKDELYDQIKRKCMKKYKMNSINKKQIMLCQHYLKIKNEIPPIDKKVIDNLLDINIEGRRLKDIVKQNAFYKIKEGIEKIPSTNLTFKAALLDIITSVLKQVGNENIKKIIDNISKQIGYLANFLPSIFVILNGVLKFILNNYTLIYRNNLFKPIKVVTKVLIDATFKHTFLFTFQSIKRFNTFILGAIEYYTTESLSYFNLIKLNLNEINLIKILFSKTPSTVIELKRIDELYTSQAIDIFDTVPNYSYYTKGGLLYPLYGRDQDLLKFNAKDIKYLKNEVKKDLNFIEQKVPFSYFTGTLELVITDEDKEMLKKKGFLDEKQNVLYLNKYVKDINKIKGFNKGYLQYYNNDKLENVNLGVIAFKRDTALSTARYQLNNNKIYIKNENTLHLEIQFLKELLENNEYGKDPNKILSNIKKIEDDTELLVIQREKLKNTKKTSNNNQIKLELNEVVRKIKANFEQLNELRKYKEILLDFKKEYLKKENLRQTLNEKYRKGLNKTPSVKKENTSKFIDLNFLDNEINKYTKLHKNLNILKHNIYI